MSLSITEYGQDNPTTLIYLHGLGVSSWMWNEHVQSLKSDYHTITIDLPGNGESYQTLWHSLADTQPFICSNIIPKSSSP